jgi:ketosteroid isomerase-like protein
VSQENVEIVRRVTAMLSEAFKTGEVPDEVTDEIAAFVAPDVRMDFSRRVFNPATYDGHAGLRSLMTEIWGAWEDFSETNERLIDIGDKVLAFQTIAGRGRASGVQVRAQSAVIWTFRDGQVVHVEVFSDRTEALKAAGVEG